MCLPGRDKRNCHVVRFHALPCLLSCSPVNNTISNSLSCTFVLEGLQIKPEGVFPVLLLLRVCFLLSFTRTRWLRDFSSDSLIQKIPTETKARRYSPSVCTSDDSHTVSFTGVNANQFNLINDCKSTFKCSWKPIKKYPLPSVSAKFLCV